MNFGGRKLVVSINTVGRDTLLGGVVGVYCFQSRFFVESQKS